MPTQTYRGSCHCGQVRFEVALDLTQPVISCNCSMCGRSGTLLAFVPASAFTLASGEDALREYRFNTNKIQHLFCTTCGIKPFARSVGPNGEDMAAINVRCLEDVDLEGLSVHPYDGKST